MSKEVSLETIVSLCKRRGFIYQGSEVYGGLAGTWDYGPLGVQLKRNIMNLWWQTFVEDRDDMYGVDAAILMNKKVWEASGHATGFNDPMVECLNCNSRFRADHLVNKEEYGDFLNGKMSDLDKKLENIIERLKKFMTEEVQGIKINPEVNSGIRVEEWDKVEGFINNASKTGEDGKKIASDFNKLKLSLGDIEQARNFFGPLTKEYLNFHNKCDRCKEQEWDEPQQFNMMFKTVSGPKYRSIDRKNSKGMKAHVEWLNKDRKPEAEFNLSDEFNELGGFMFYEAESISYLRPETAQGIFTNYKNVLDSFYPDIPFGIAQMGKAFRNEISPRDFVFRSREFEQMEIEYFVRPDEWEKAFEQWREAIQKFLSELGLPKDKVHEMEVAENDRAHYSKRTIDFEFDYPHGRDELLGLAYRTDFDLQNIQKASGKNMEYKPKDGEKSFVPHVIEPSFGVERAIMAVLTAAYKEDEVGGEKRSYLKLPANLAPVKVAVSPLLKNKPELAAKAQEVYKTLKKEFGNVMYDDNGNIGKRYRRQDEIGTPYCVTIDFDTLEDDTVTVRHRDTTKQERIKIKNLITMLY